METGLRLQTFHRDEFILRRHLKRFCVNIKVRNYVLRRKIFKWESTLDVQTHYIKRKTLQYTNFYGFHPSGANKEFVKGETLHLFRMNSSRCTFNKKRIEFQNTRKEWRIPRWQFWEVYGGYDARCHWLKERAITEYKRQSWAEAATPSVKLYDVQPFPELLFGFFSLTESEISEHASRQVATEEPYKGL